MNERDSYLYVIRLARTELKAGAVFTVFEYSAKWYELRKVYGNPKQICGARKKTGERCRSKMLHRGGKCKFHGGLSTGARTPEGKAKSIAAMQAGRWKSVT